MDDRAYFDSSLVTLQFEMQAGRHGERSLRASALLFGNGAETELEWEESVGIFKLQQRLIGASVQSIRHYGRRLGMTNEEVDSIIDGIEIRVYTEYDADKEDGND